MWKVASTDEFDQWWQTLSRDEQESLSASVKLLRQLGPLLGRPHADSVKGSRYTNRKELRTQCKGRP